MRSHDLNEERIEGLLRGVPPESEREARLEGMIRELRAAAPSAPPLVRERVRLLHEPEPRRRFAWRPALVALPLAAAMVAGGVVLSRGGGSGGEEAVSLSPTTRSLAPSVAPDEWGAQEDSAARSAHESFQGVLQPVPGGRAQEWDVELALRVPHNDRLSEASADAIRTTRELGGFVVSSSVRTNGPAGDANLVLRIPSRRVQDAIARLSALGTITGQRVAIQDRQEELDRLARRIDTLRVQIAEINLRLRTELLSEPDRLRLELRRQRLTGLVNSVTSQRGGVSREVALAEISLTISTGKAAAAPPEGRFEDAVGRAWDVLSTTGAVALFLLIVLSPLALVVALALVARRRFRRRSEERILDQPRPATGSPH